MIEACVVSCVGCLGWCSPSAISFEQSIQGYWLKHFWLELQMRRSHHTKTIFLPSSILQFISWSVVNLVALFMQCDWLQNSSCVDSVQSWFGSSNSFYCLGENCCTYRCITGSSSVEHWCSIQLCVLVFPTLYLSSCCKGSFICHKAK